jgi:excisionase family DNA binding protein
MGSTGKTERNRFLTTGEIANLCGMSQQTIIRQIDKGYLEGFRIPGSTHRRVSLTNLRNWMEQTGIDQGDLDDYIGVDPGEQNQQVSDLRQA